MDEKSNISHGETEDSWDDYIIEEHAVAHPLDSREVRYVLSKRMPILTTAAKHTAFGSLERNIANH